MRGSEIKLLKLLNRIFPSQSAWVESRCGVDYLDIFTPNVAFIVIYVSVGLVTAYL